MKAVFPNRAHQLLTTRSWNFLGLETAGAVSASSLWTKARFGEYTIIGNLDTGYSRSFLSVSLYNSNGSLWAAGVWPESASFRDKGYGPIPAKWKGICDSGVDHTFSCNRSLHYLVVEFSSQSDAKVHADTLFVSSGS